MSVQPRPGQFVFPVRPGSRRIATLVPGVAGMLLLPALWGARGWLQANGLYFGGLDAIVYAVAFAGMVLTYYQGFRTHALVLDDQGIRAGGWSLAWTDATVSAGPWAGANGILGMPVSRILRP